MMSFTQRLEQSRSSLLTGLHVLRCESSSPAGRCCSTYQSLQSVTAHSLSLCVRMLVFQSVSDVLKCAADINQLWIIGLLLLCVILKKRNNNE